MHKRFYIKPPEYNGIHTYFHCNTKRDWQTFLTTCFEPKFGNGLNRFEKTISNASFRIAGLEMKAGLLLYNDEREEADATPMISGAILPSLVIDSVLSTFSILEGLSMLSFLASVPEGFRLQEIEKADRGDKFAKGLKAATGENHGPQVDRLRKLRDRCIHQDHADQKDDLDYEHIFETSALRPHIELLYFYLYRLALDDSPVPETNLKDFADFGG